MNRPVQPTTRKQLAQMFALLDPRCGFEQHNEVASGGVCPHCHLDLRTYVDAMPEVWP